MTRPSVVRRDVGARIAPVSAAAAQLVYFGVAAAAWPDRRRVELILGVHLARFAALGAIALVAEHLRRRRRARGEVGVRWMAAVTVVTGLLTLHFAQWSAAALVSIPFTVIALTSNIEREGPYAGALYTALAAALAWNEGVSLASVATMAATCCALQVLVEMRARLLSESVALAEARRKALITAQERMEQLHAQALNQEKLSSLGLLAAGVAHEVNNPMSYVTSNLEELQLELAAHRHALPEPLRRAVDELLPSTIDGVQRVNTIVGDLRRYAREEREIEEEFDLNEQVRASLRICKSALRHQVEAEVRLGVLPRITGRPNQITQLVINLVVNAAESIRGRGFVRVTTAAERDEVLLAVEDNGCGMDDATVRRMFDPFFTTKRRGTGLGLAVVHGIVGAHGGRISVESLVGSGTRITVRLPARRASEREAA